MKRRLYFNSISSLVYQVFVVIVGLIMPRLTLVYYGSSVNGLVQSITQMLSVISMLDLGVGAVVQAALYKPLADKDDFAISKIYSAAQKYFRVIAIGVVAYVVFLCGYYGIAKSEEYSWVFSSGIILAISIGYFSQYFYGICNTLVLNSDQKVYVSTLINLSTLIISTIISVLLIVNGSSIQFVKLASSIVFLVRPYLLSSYIKKHYVISVDKSTSLNVIPNKWSGLAQHISTILTSSIGNILLTIFSTFQLVSVYNVYIMPLNAVRNLMEVSSTGYKSFFGNLIAKEQQNILENEFNRYEVLMHYLVTVIFGSIVVVLVPFVMLYTKGIYDVDYYDLSFSVSITLAYAMYTLRLTYSNLIFAAGKFRETKIYSIIECALNLGISVMLVKPLGLTGVAIGTCVSSGYRMSISAYYLKRDILKRDFKHFLKHVGIDALSVSVTILYTIHIKVASDSYFLLIISSILVFLGNVIICTLLTAIFYRKTFTSAIKSILRRT